MKTPTCPHTKAQTGFAYLCRSCREDIAYLADLEKDLTTAIDTARLAELYDLKEKP